MKPQNVALKDLYVNLFVRKALNQDHVIALAELIAEKVEMYTRIRVAILDGKMVIVDGRHRKEAYDLCNITHVVVDIDTSITNETELIAAAYKANVGGALPPTTGDTEQTVALLLERGETKKHIGELLGLPAGLARKYVNTVQSRLTRSKLHLAAEAIAEDGLTVAKAAEKFGVDPEQLKEVVSGNRRKTKQGVAEIQRMLTSQYRSMSTKNGCLLKKLLEKYEDSDITRRQLEEIIKHLEVLQRKSGRALADWKARFEAMNGSKAA